MNGVVYIGCDHEREITEPCDTFKEAVSDPRVQVVKMKLIPFVLQEKKRWTSKRTKRSSIATT